MGGRDLSFWTFDANNVLAWADEAGYTAWLQFTVLPGGPVFMGTLHPSGQDAAASDAGESPPLHAESGSPTEPGACFVLPHSLLDSIGQRCHCLAWHYFIAGS